MYVNAVALHFTRPTAPRSGTPNRRPPVPPLPAVSLEDESAMRAPFRLVLPRDKRDRLASRAALLAARRRCYVPGCAAEGMPVLLVESEHEALLCPVHQLVRTDGSRIEGQPMLATAAW
jgi:hypothetical protein